MDFRILGSLEAWSGQTRLTLGGPRERKVLALLLLDANRTVSLAHLVDALWDEAPPATAEKQIRNAVSRLRAVFEAGPAQAGHITVEGAAGYRIEVPEQALDAAVFERETAEADAAAAAGDLVGAADLLRAALDRWRGPALAGMTGRVIEAEAAAWDERRLAVRETYTDHQLALGRHPQVIAGLSALVAEHPLRERPACQLMLALYRAGRQSDALAVFHGVRSRLADDMGLDAGPAIHRLHQQILTNDPEVAAPGSDRPRPAGRPQAADEPPVPRQLPAAVRHFTGRDRHLKLLDEVAWRGAESGGTAVISAIGGTAGIGKSALAVYWAQTNADRFPHGQLHVNLRGFAPGARPMTATEALRGFLVALGVPAAGVPQQLDAQTALYRSLLAGRRMLVLLDNARDSDQVRPLLPGTPSCVVVITSRNQLTGLIAAEGATPIALDLLSPAESYDLLSRRLGPERTAAEPEATAALTELCARLPLALGIAAARAIVTPTLSVADLVAALADVRDRLDILDTGDAGTDLRAVFSWSYEHLTEPAARLFRLLSLHPGPDVSGAAAASLAGIPPAEAGRALRELTRAHLVVEHVTGRFTFHDLLRAYAAELAGRHDGDEVRRDAVVRLLDHYLHTAVAAERLLVPGPAAPPPDGPAAGTRPERLGDARQAARWMDQEHQVLLAVAAHTDVYGFDARSSRLAWIVMSLFGRRGPQPPTDKGPAGAQVPARDTPEPASGAPAPGGLAREAWQGGAPARVHRGLGPHYSWLVEYPDVLAHLERFAAVYRDLDDQTGLAHIHFGTGAVLEQRGRHPEALDHARRALDLFVAVDHRGGQARARNAVGWLHARLGDHPSAIAHCGQALELYRELGDRPMQAVTLDNLGYAQHCLGRYEQAVRAYEQSLALTRELGDPYEEAITLSHLGDTHQARGDRAAAVAVRDRALAILDGLSSQDAEALRAATDL
ncbi:AfsR/SARP family transcriptional regulator [Streptomyces sp. CA-111067]|uniref:AfsR/SARP family transcriptional regulator n=1 Tax=Streptomyces sp. CA-111067 TaxID=3240046 RepID=UPI003D968C72